MGTNPLDKVLSEYDHIRRARILKIILLGNIILFSIFLVTTFINSHNIHPYDGISPIVMASLIFAFFAITKVLKTGYLEAASYSLVVIYMSGSIYIGYRWGISLPMTIFSIAITTFTVFTIFPLKNAQRISIFIAIYTIYLGTNEFIIGDVDNTWNNNNSSLLDIIVYISSLIYIMFLSFISNNEIEKSLRKSVESESMIQRERDRLEYMVKVKTKELRSREIERIKYTYYVAQFGAISQGIFHDLANMFTVILHQINIIEDKIPETYKIKENLDSVNRITLGIKNLINSTRHLITSRSNNKTQATEEYLNLRVVAQEIIGIYSHAAKDSNITLNNYIPHNIHIYIDKTKISQIISNLVKNSIDAITSTSKGDKITVIAYLIASGIKISIHDNGPGIPKCNRDKIFEPFFTTNYSNHSLGIGLNIVKNIIEMELKGSIVVGNQPGAHFEIIIPQTSRSSPRGG